jgi:bla regulator protein BlaR1
MTDFLNHWGPVWSSYFAFTIIQNTLFVGLILLVLYMVRNTRAHIKYAIALVGMLKLLVPPFLQLNGLHLPFATLPATAVVVSSETIMPLTLSPALAGPDTAVTAGTDLNAAGVLLLIWMIVVGGYLILSLISTLRLRLILRSAVPIDDWPGVPRLRGRAIGIYRSGRISMPLTLGVFPGRIFVPLCWDEWTEDCRRTVISHEIAHIERRDGLVQLLEILIRSLYFFHPLVWILAAKLGTYREMACDDAAVSKGSRSPAAYSRYLVEIAERLLANPVGCQSASALVRQRHELIDRVRYQIKEGEMIFLSKRIKHIILIGLRPGGRRIHRLRKPPMQLWRASHIPLNI